MRLTVPTLVAAALALSAGCQQKVPTAQSDAPGKAPSWGQNYQTAPPAAPGTGASNLLDKPISPPSTGGDQAALPPGHPPIPPSGDLAARGLPVAEAPGAAPAQGAMPNDDIHNAARNRPAPGGAMGGSGTDWGGGDPVLGKSEFGNRCARCHGMEGKGTTLPDVGVVPDLTLPAFHERMGDAAIASLIAHGKGKMPPFMESLDGAKLRGLVAYVRTLRK